MNVEDSAHNQAEASGTTEKNGISILHYHPQENETDKFISWYGMCFNLRHTINSIKTPSFKIHYSALRKWKEILLTDSPSSLDLAAISNFCTREKLLFLKSRPQEALRMIRCFSEI